MRLSGDNELPEPLIRLIRLQFAHGLMVVAMATVIWLFSQDNQALIQRALG